MKGGDENPPTRHPCNRAPVLKTLDLGQVRMKPIFSPVQAPLEYTVLHLRAPGFRWAAIYTAGFDRPSYLDEDKPRGPFPISSGTFSLLFKR